MLTLKQKPWIVGALILLGLSYIVHLKFLLASFVVGGHVWLQGDWLISLAAGPIRRGILGEAFLTLSDATGVPPLTLLIAVQCAVLSIVFLGFMRLLVIQNRQVFALLIFSPAIFAIVWSIDPISALRKEIIAIAALVLLTLPGGSISRLVLSGLLMMMGGLGHEITILLLPAWLICIWMFHRPLLASKFGLAVIGAVLAVGTWELVYALRHVQISDVKPMCQALIDRGLSEQRLCGGAIAWLADPDNGATKVAEALGRSWTIWLMPFAIAIAAAPAVRIWITSQSHIPHAGLLIVLAIGPICLLYPVGLDWGRWIAVQYTVAVLLMLGLSARSQLTPISRISNIEIGFWGVGALLWGFRHDPVLTSNGFLWNLIKTHINLTV